MKRLALVVVSALSLYSAPVAMADTPPDLAKRIKTVFDADPPVNPQTHLSQVEPIMKEAMAVADISPDDFARISLIYALALYNSGKPAEAREVIAAAIAVVRARGGGDENSFMSNLLMNYAVYQSNSGDPEAGLATQGQALALLQKQGKGDSPEAGAIYGSMAFASGRLGRQRDALNYYRMSIERMNPEVDSASSYVANLGSFANNLRVTGDYDEALKYSQMNIDAAVKYLPEGHRAFGYAYSNAGEIMMALGRYGEAEALFRQAQEFAKEHRGRDSFDAGLFTFNLARAIAARGREDDAEALMLESLTILEKTTTGSAPLAPGMVWMSLGVISANRGDIDEAILREKKALEAFVTFGNNDATIRAQVETFLAEFLFLNGELETALSYAESAVKYYRKELEPYAPFRIKAESIYALLLSRQGRTDEALREAQTYVDAMVAYLDRGGARNSSNGLISGYAIGFVRFADIALAANRPDLAFIAAQRAAQSEISLTSHALAARAAVGPAASDAVKQFQDAQVHRLNLDRERNFARGKSASEVARLDNEIATADSQLSALGAHLKDVFPDYAKLSHPEPNSAASIAAGLARQQAVIMPLLGDDRLITLVVTREGLTWDAYPLSRLRAEVAVDTLRRGIDTGLQAGQANGFPREAAWQLGGAIFTPKIAAALKNKREVDILGGGKLMSLPLGLLLTQAPHGDDSDPRALRDSAWLIKSYALSVRPAFVTLPAYDRAEGGFLGVGAPVLGPVDVSQTALDSARLYRGGGDRDVITDVDALRQLPSLAGAEVELNRIQSALGLTNSRLLIGNEATEAHIRASSADGGLARYSVVAFATHGLTSGHLQSLREPALVLTPPTQATASDDGLLTTSDIAGLRLNARWVILSACNSGAGREASAAGYSGLAQAFMQAGTDNLLVSMWPVRDDVAGRLSVDTVRRHARGAGQARALQAAILALMRDTSVPDSANPAVWAPFSLIAR